MAKIKRLHKKGKYLLSLLNLELQQMYSRVGKPKQLRSQFKIHTYPITLNSKLLVDLLRKRKNGDLGKKVKLKYYHR